MLKIMLNKSVFYGFAALLFFLFLLPVSVKAIENGQIGIRPAYPDEKNPASIGRFDYSLDAGITKNDGVEVINTTPLELKIRIYSVDATNTADGTFALEGEGTIVGVGGWVKMEQNELTIPAQSSVIAPFTITIPQGIEPGDYMGGIIIQEAVPPKADGNIQIINRVGVRIYERVPGAIIKDMEITQFTWNFVAETPEEMNNVNLGKLQSFLGFRRKVMFNLSTYNKGTVRLETGAKLEVWNMFGKLMLKKDSALGIMFPKKGIISHIDWLKEGSVPLFGRYHANVSILYDENKAPLTAQLVFWAIPYTLFVVLGILIALFVLFYLNKLLIQELAKREMEVYLVQKDDTLLSISQNFGIKWKKLAKINHIKKPYHLWPGQQMFIPRKAVISLFFKQMMRKKSNFYITVGIVVLLLAGIGGWSYFQFSNEKKAPENANNTNSTVSFQPSPEEARDETRKADLSNIQTALVMYFAQNNKYPIAVETVKTNLAESVLVTGLVGSDFISSLPKDPQDPAYYYGYKSDGTTYELTCVLENVNDPEAVSVNNYKIYKLTSPIAQ